MRAVLMGASDPVTYRAERCFKEVEHLIGTEVSIFRSMEQLAIKQASTKTSYSRDFHSRIVVSEISGVECRNGILILYYTVR